MENTYSASYSVEDNKLRLTASNRLDSKTYEKAKNLGFRKAHLQGLFVAPKWTPSREDFCLELAGEITAEETTMVERAEAKAERLDNLASKRNQEANSFRDAADRISECFASGQPILKGHHSERKARKDKEKMERAINKATSSRETANYWMYRAEGVERHANRKADPGIRSRRIKTLLAELRDRQRDINHAHICFNLWTLIDNESNEDRFKMLVENYVGAQLETGAATPMGYYTEFKDQKVTHREIVKRCIENSNKAIHGDSTARWINHILNRLGYERSELGDVRRFEGSLTRTILQAFSRNQGAHKPNARKNGDQWVLSSSVPLPLHIADCKELSLSDGEWRDLMESSGYEVPVAKPRKSVNRSNKVPLINPTAKEAATLQALWNQNMIDLCNKKNVEAKIAELKETEQAIFSENSKGDYAAFKTIELDKYGREITSSWNQYKLIKSSEPICRVRVYVAGDTFYKARSLAILTDKPGKSLPISWVQKEMVCEA